MIYSFSEETMFFEDQMYRMYLNNDLYLPLGEIALGLFLIATSLISFFQALRGGESDYGLLFVAFVALTFLIRGLVQLSRGAALFHDSGKETFEITGVIEKITEPPFPAQYYIGEDKRSSVYITINGEKYYGVSLPGVSCGDEVYLVVYSKCKFFRKAVLIRKAKT